MIKKQNLWFLTLFSLILVLSVYYITMPNDLLVAKNAANKKETVKKDTTTVKESDNLTALRVSKEEEREEEKSDLKKTMTKEDATTEPPTVNLLFLGLQYRSDQDLYNWFSVTLSVLA